MRTKLIQFVVAVLVSMGSAHSALAAGEKIIRMKSAVKGEYIVHLAETLPAEQVRSLAFGLALQHGGRLGHVFERVVPGFVVTLPDGAAEALSRHPLVEYLEEVAESTLSQYQSPAPWHLDRVDQRTLPLDGVFAGSCGSGTVYAYIVDSGVLAAHSEFDRNGVSRVIAGKNFVGFDPDSTATAPCVGPHPSSPCADYDPYCLGGGHGTAVASVLGGRTYGPAKGVSFISVRTHDCTGTGTTARIASGVEWIYNDKASRPGAAVANMSFTAPAAQIEYDASQPGATGTAITKRDQLLMFEKWIGRIILERNITVVAAAGNSDLPATNFSPARLARDAGFGGKVISVGGSNSVDWRWKCNSANAWESCNEHARASNFGKGVNIFAPTQNVPSAGIKAPDASLVCCVDSNTAERQGARSGTSFAAPLVAGIAAMHLYGTAATLTPDQVWQILLNDASGGTTAPSVMQQQGTPDANSAPLNGPTTFVDRYSPNRLLFRLGQTRCRM